MSGTPRGRQRAQKTGRGQALPPGARYAAGSRVPSPSRTAVLTDRHALKLVQFVPSDRRAQAPARQLTVPDSAAVMVGTSRWRSWRRAAIMRPNAEHAGARTELP